MHVNKSYFMTYQKFTPRQLRKVRKIEYGLMGSMVEALEDSTFSYVLIHCPRRQQQVGVGVQQ
jgi:hypothetical protein